MNHFDLKIIPQTVEISVKSDTTSTLSLIIHSEIEKKPAKKYISIQGGEKLRIPSNFFKKHKFTF